ncbi:MAG TPA: gliding motility lipoprotein GldH [Chitinophagaceae bacterium]|nr:gliding motility lipoprotein GldH [Chitinophagaceae bacterium]
MKKKLFTVTSFYLLPFTFLLLTASCGRIDMYEKVSPIPKQEWQSSYKPSFTFSISDTTAAYQLFLILRHNNKYNYNNLWVNVYRKKPNGQVSKVLYELRLAGKEGWTATGMDDIFEHRLPLAPQPNDSFYFDQKGPYTFTVEHIMREEPLDNVLNVGVRIEKK